MFIRGGSRGKYLAVRQKVDDLFLVVALKTQIKTTKSTTPTLQKRPAHVAGFTTAYCCCNQRFGGQGSDLDGATAMPQRKPRLMFVYKPTVQERGRIGSIVGYVYM